MSTRKKISAQLSLLAPLFPSPLPPPEAPPVKKKRSAKVKAPRVPRVAERDIQAAIILWLKKQGWRVVRHHPVQPLAGRFVKLRGADIGFPDLIAARFPYVLFIEVKAIDGTLSPEQIEMHSDPHIGPFCICVRSLEEFEQVFSQRGLPGRLL